MYRISFATLFAITLAGCGGNNPSTKGKDGQELKVNPSSVSLKQGESKGFDFSISKTKFDEDVKLTFSGLPDGVSTDGDTTIKKGSTKTTINFKAADAAKPVNAVKAKVKGAGGGIDNEQEFSVTVTEKK